MRKFILLTALLMSASLAYCQYFTIKVGGGYSWPGVQNSGSVLTFQPGTNPDPANAAIIPLVNYNVASADSTSRYKSNIYAGYGEGGHFDFSLGYMFTPYFGVELDAAALWGKTITASQTYDDPLLGANANIITKTHSTGISVNPSLVYRAAKPSSKIAPYARLGLALPISGAIYHTLDITAPNSLLGDLTNATIGVKTTATVSVGIQGAAGISYTPFPLLSFWGEVDGQYLFIRAKESQLTAYSISLAGKPTQNMISGTNIITGTAYSTYSQVISYVDQLNTSSNTTDFGKQRASTPSQSGTPGYVNENAPHQELRQIANLGAFGFTVGVTINMSKKVFKDPFGKKKNADAAPVH